jgi:radical SAM protein with 4Fe4S-binding SPASM domain
MQDLRSAQFHLTSACNLKCAHCYLNASEQQDNELSFDEWQAILKGLPDSIQEIDLTGGEPLLLPWLFDYAKQIKDKGIYPSLFTNGTLVTSQTAGVIADLFGTVLVSIDGMRAYHDQFRGVAGAFDRTVSGIEMLGESGANVIVNITLTPGVLSDLSRLLEFAATLPVSMVRLSKCMPFGRGKALDEPSTPILVDSVTAAVKKLTAAPQDDVEFELDVEWFRNAPTENHVCGAAVHFVSVKPNGDVTACSTLADKRFVAGNLRHRSLTDIWAEPHSELFSELRSMTIEQVLQACPEDCPARSLCSGGCRALAFAKTRNLSSPESFNCTMLTEFRESLGSCFPGMCSQ